MSLVDLQVSENRSWLVFGLVLLGLLLCGACGSSQRTMAQDNVASLTDTLLPPANAVLLFEDAGVSKPDRRGCWAAYVDRVYGTDDSTLLVLSHYEQLLSDFQGWIKNPIIVSDDTVVYDHPDGSSVHISTEIAYDYPREFEKYHTRFKTLFYQLGTWQSPDLRKKCREY